MVRCAGSGRSVRVDAPTLPAENPAHDIQTHASKLVYDGRTRLLGAVDSTWHCLRRGVGLCIHTVVCGVVRGLRMRAGTARRAHHGWPRRGRWLCPAALVRERVRLIRLAHWRFAVSQCQECG